MKKKNDIVCFVKVLKKYKQYAIFKKNLKIAINAYLRHGYASTWRILIGYAYISDKENLIGEIMTILETKCSRSMKPYDIIYRILNYSLYNKLSSIPFDILRDIQNEIYNEIKEKYAREKSI